MTTAGFQCCIYAIYIDCMLLHQYSSYRFKGNPEEDVLSVTYTALDTTGMIGFRFMRPQLLKIHHSALSLFVSDL